MKTQILIAILSGILGFALVNAGILVGRHIERQAIESETKTETGATQ